MSGELTRYEYHVVQAVDLDSLEQSVNLAGILGWKACGSPQPFARLRTTQWLQAMIRPSPLQPAAGG